MIKIKLPKKRNIEYIKEYFKKFGIFRHFKSDKNLFSPNLNDLYLIHQFILLNKRIAVLEFGCGWSTLVMKHALNLNKIKYLKDIKKLRKKNYFEIFSIDNQKKYLEITKKRNNLILGKNNKINYIFSECVMTKFNNRICSEYKKLPIINPDFIYLDGPNPFSVKGKINSFNMSHKELMPMSCDILKIEHFLIPGTIILVDGRTANARFLRSNFQRNWMHKEDLKNDQHIFLLNEKPLGLINKEIINFYNK